VLVDEIEAAASVSGSVWVREEEEERVERNKV